MKSSMPCVLRISFLLLLFANVSAQVATGPQTPSSENAPVFHAQSKLVIVDVIVTDKSGKAVTGLKASDFRLSENGVQQELRVFEEHSVATFTPRSAPPPPPRNQYTNVPIDAPKNSVNLLLLDMLNTPAAEQQWARQQMLKALRNLPTGQQVALFILGRGLKMIQGVSSDADTLVAAADALVAQPDSLTSSIHQHQASIDRITMLPQASGMANDPAFPVGPSEAGIVQERLLLGFVKVENAASDQRVRLTLDALGAIGRTMSAYPGRKSLIWVTSGIPFQILPQMHIETGHEFYSSRDYARAISQTASVLADSQIAIYPIDVKGLATTSVSTEDIAVGAGGDSTLAVADVQTARTTGIWDSRNSMKNLAYETGGRAFFGSNDLATEITRSMEEGSQYYTLAYIPTNRKNDGLYRNIKVTTQRTGLEMAYRHGYFATQEPSPSTGDESVKVLAAALQPGMPPATSILMKVQVMPPDASHKTSRIDYAVETGDVQLVETPDQFKHFTLDFMAVAWDSDGRMATSASDTLSPSLKAEFNMASLNGGIPASQELTLKPGKYVLSLGVIDRNSRRIGTVWVPLTVPQSK